MTTRRSVLRAGLQLAAAGALSRAAGALVLPAPAQPLKSAASPCGLQVGIMGVQKLLQDPPFAQAVTRNFNLLTVDGMKWDRIHPQPDVFDFSEADWGMAFAERNGMRVHGHNLCWNMPLAYPPWFHTVLNKSNAEQYLVNHIHTVAGRYKGRIDSWDVVNEPVVSWPGQKDGYYPGIWLDLLGPDYIDIAFRATAQADPNALRVLNIHHVEQGTVDNETTRRNAIAMLNRLMTRGVPVQAVGLESHLDVSQPLGGDALRSFIREIQSLGLVVMITEFDVKESRETGSSQDWDRAVAQCYADYLNLVLPMLNGHRLIFWSLQDRWENGKRIQGLLEADFSPRSSFGAVDSVLARNCI